jgi:hypothetical protein
MAWALTEDGKFVEAAEWIDADSDGNPESIKAYQQLDTTNGVHIARAFEYVDADSDGNPEKLTLYEVGKIEWTDEGVAALSETEGEELPPAEELTDVEAPTTEDLSLPDGSEQVDGLETPWQDNDLRPWETPGADLHQLS